MAANPNVNAANKYARDVVSGRITAGLYVRQACQRHLDDLEKAKNGLERAIKRLAKMEADLAAVGPRAAFVEASGRWRYAEAKWPERSIYDAIAAEERRLRENPDLAGTNGPMRAALVKLGPAPSGSLPRVKHGGASKDPLQPPDTAPETLPEKTKKKR